MIVEIKEVLRPGRRRQCSHTRSCGCHIRLRSINMGCKEERIDVEDRAKQLNDVLGQILDNQNSALTAVVVLGSIMQQMGKTL